MTFCEAQMSWDIEQETLLAFEQDNEAAMALLELEQADMGAPSSSHGLAPISNSPHPEPSVAQGGQALEQKTGDDDQRTEALGQRSGESKGVNQPGPSDAVDVRRRLRTKQPKPQAFKTDAERSMEKMLQAAVDAEGDKQLALLPVTVKRKHVHWTHVRTHDPKHVQPSSLTRKGFWGHLSKCYAEVYPDTSSPTGSILAFGLVAVERHLQAAQEVDRDEHKHCATFSNQQHYWNKVAKHSLKKYNVPLNAVAHDSYVTMYAYLRVPSKKKPLGELDTEPYMSQYHPRAQDLHDLLMSSHKYSTLNDARRSHGEQKRKRLSLFDEIQSHDLRTVTQFQAYACEQAKKGNNSLAEFCTRQGHKIEDLLRNTWNIVEAPTLLMKGKESLIDKMQKAAAELPCVCSGRWAPGAAAVLSLNAIDVKFFCSMVLRALRVGAKRGSNVACVGEGGCGKSTLLEALENIFDCAAKPEAGSTFPLASAADHDLCLWQDYEHDENTVRFSDLLSFFLGESVGIHIPGALNKKFKNVAPCFYSGRCHMELLPSHKHSSKACEKYNGMMDERFTIFRFNIPLPREQRLLDWPSCGCCAAKFYLSEGTFGTNVFQSPSRSGQFRPPPIALERASGSGPGQVQFAIASELEKLACLHRQGVLDTEEFRSAKRRLIQA
jgi:hypothetical protein